MFSYEERQIFRIELAGKQLTYDPLAVKRQIIETATKHETDLVADFILLDTDQSIESGALGRVVKVFREVFGLSVFATDGTGYLDQDVLYAAEQFANFMNDLKKNIVTSPTSPIATDCPAESATKVMSE